MKHVVSSSAVALLIVLLGACGAPSERQEAEISEALGPALELYSRNELDQALALFQDAARAQPDDPEVHAWVAEAARRLWQFDLVSSETKAALDIDSCHSFAHTVLGDAFRPELSDWEATNADSSWAHYHRAVACDSADGNPWIGIWSGAMHRGDHAMEERALRQLVMTGFLTPTVLAFNRWVLHSLPERSILITNGDWDTFPALALQVVEGMRGDVGIVNRSLLNLAWYADLMSQRYGVTLPLTVTAMESYGPVRDDDGMMVTLSDVTIRGWMESSNVSGRPLVFAPTVDLRSFEKVAHLQFAGAHWRLPPEGDRSEVDAESVRIAMAAASGSDFSTPEVSQQDRSAIRRLAARNRSLAKVVLYTGYRYAEAMLRAGDTGRATEALAWAERFADDARLEGEHREIVERLRAVVR
ncbi:MAG: hypothetical protein JSW71_00285 [Gemmatimonadota bacterium]|nr:MAG: hypothetical protein JSW71_00285 [Gemmatimonadota bacterium]